MYSFRWLLADIESLIPNWGYASTVQEVPKLDDPAPRSPLPLPKDKPAILLFTRHLGCPYCETEIRRLISLAQAPEYKTIQFIIITHSVPTAELEDFVAKELGLDSSTNVAFYGDPDRKVYAAYGLQEIPLLSIVNPRIVNEVQQMQKQGISNRFTRGTRWQTNGAFAISKDGLIQYVHVAKEASDMSDLQAALVSIDE